MYSLVPEVRWQDAGTHVLLLDLRKGVYLALDAGGSAIWRRLLAGVEETEVVSGLCTEFETSPEEASECMTEFVERCLSQGLLYRGRAAHPPMGNLSLPRSDRWLSIRAWLWLFRTARQLRREGFGACYARARSFVKPEERCSTSSLRDRATRAFVRAEGLYWDRRAPNDCVSRSLAFYQFLLAVGVRADHRIGVRYGPFAAHAWVESDGRPLLEASAYTEAFDVIAEF